MDRRTVVAFNAGRIAFHLDKVVENWRQAIALRPGNTKYAHGLNRAPQLQERLRILRSETDLLEAHTHHA